MKGVVIMTSRKAVLGIMAVLACAAVIIGSLLAFDIIDPDYQCGTKSLERVNQTNEVFKKYKSLFNRYPSRTSVWRAFLRDEKTGERTKTWGIMLVVSEKVDQDTLPPEDRIPDKIEGVPVQIIPWEIVAMVKPFQWERSSTEHADYVYAVMWKYRELFDDYPFSDGPRFEFLEPGSEPQNEIWGIDLWVTETVHNLGLSPTTRIPNCLEDVPVIITLKPKHPDPGSQRLGPL